MDIREIALVRSLVGLDVEGDAALQTALEKCESGDGNACTAVAAQYLSSGRLEEGFRLAEDGCSQGSGLSCLLAAALLAKRGDDLSSSDRWARADELLSRECSDKRSPGSCFALGVYLHSGAGGLLKDSARGLQMLDIGCEEGNKASCITAGMVLDDRGPDVDGRITNAQANLRYKFACDFGSASACHTVGERMEFDQLVEEDEDKKLAMNTSATAHYRRGCELGKMESCAAAGTRLVQEGKPSLALPYLMKAAEADDPGSCLLAGMIYGYGQQQQMEDVRFLSDDGNSFDDMEEEEQRLPGVPISSMARPSREPAYKQANYETAQRLLKHCCENLEHSACCSALNDIRLVKNTIL